MKTREEIEQHYKEQMNAALKRYYKDMDAARAARAAALAELDELDDPMARLIAAGRRAMKSHNGARECRCGQCIELRDAIDYAEQRRAREAREGL